MQYILFIPNPHEIFEINLNKKWILNAYILIDRLKNIMSTVPNDGNNEKKEDEKFCWLEHKTITQHYEQWKTQSHQHEIRDFYNETMKTVYMKKHWTAQLLSTHDRGTKRVEPGKIIKFKNCSWIEHEWCKKS